MSTRTSRVRHRFPTLASVGLAVEHFPRFVNRRLEMHQVDVVLLTFIICGEGWHHIAGERFRESGSSLAVTHFGQAHSILTVDEGMDVINVYLDPARLLLPALPAPFYQVLARLLPLHPQLLHNCNRVVRLQFDDPMPLAQLLFAIKHELEQQTEGWHASVHLHWTIFLLFCCRQAFAKGFVPRPHERRDIEELREYLDRSYEAEHTLPDLARRVHLSPTSLCRVFKEHTGKTVFDYLIERRVHAAMLRLRTTEDKILTIALECGFTDVSFFHRKFRQIVGMTPRQYRRQPAQRQ